MSQNGNNKRTAGSGRVARISETGFKIEGRDGWFSFARAEEREGAFEIPIAGDFIEYKYAKDAGGSWVYAINVLSRWEPPKTPQPFDPGKRRNEASRETVREERLIRAPRYSGQELQRARDGDGRPYAGRDTAGEGAPARAQEVEGVVGGMLEGLERWYFDPHLNPSTAHEP